jgi:hypothetical protein
MKFFMGGEGAGLVEVKGEDVVLNYAYDCPRCGGRPVVLGNMMSITGFARNKIRCSACEFAWFLSEEIERLDHLVAAPGTAAFMRRAPGPRQEPAKGPFLRPTVAEVER